MYRSTPWAQNRAVNTMLSMNTVAGVHSISVPMGAAVALYADQAARLAFMPAEVPAGMLTAIVGAPIMMCVARRVT
jgi:ABC-type Fe3+-siderophore transport system permease subunit